MITVRVKLFATLRRYHPHLKLGQEMPVDLPDGATVEQLIEQLGLPTDEVKLIFVNNKVRKPVTRLADGDGIGLFPPVGGG